MVSPSDFANRIKNEPKKLYIPDRQLPLVFLFLDLLLLPSDWHFRSQWGRQISS